MIWEREMDRPSDENQEIRSRPVTPRMVSSQASVGVGRALSKCRANRRRYSTGRVVAPCGGTATRIGKSPDDE